MPALALRCLGGLLLASCFSALPVASASPDDAAGWEAVRGSASLDASRWKLGNHSLRWDFEAGGTLVRAEDESLRQALASPAGGVTLWLYCASPLPGRLTCRVGSHAFPVLLGFAGWRAVWVTFAEDGEPAEPVQGFHLTAPAVSGAIWIDAVGFGAVPWFRQADAQVPYVNHRRAAGRYWMTSHDWSAVPVPVPDRAPSAAEQAAFAEIVRRYDAWMFGRMDDPRPPVGLRRAGLAGYIASGHKAFETLGLERRDGGVVGPGAFAGSGAFAGIGIGAAGIGLGDQVLQPIALPLAYDAHLNDDERARQRFLDLIDYAHDQGWAAGSQMGTGYGTSLRIAGYVHAVYILREFLRREGRLEREMATLAYHLNMGETYQEPERPGANADDLRTRLTFRLLLILMQEDSPEKLRDMLCFRRWANAALGRAPGASGTIKPDGTVFHHGTAYASAYGSNAVHMASIVHYLLRDTEFALSVEAGANLKEALLTLRFMAGDYHVPMGVSGRWPFSGPVMVETSAALGILAESLRDDELGRAFARLWRPEHPWFEHFFASVSARIYWAHTPGSLPVLLDVAARYRPEPAPQGHRVYPYAAMGIHRRGPWVASVRGWSKYVWHYESGPGQNVYGRYSSYGMLQILGQGDPVTPADSGYSEEGWDWLRPPGATVIRTSLDDLASAPALHRVYTHDPFVGGVSLAGSDGLWAMRFADPHYDTSFRFRKSVVFVDGTIVCVGSGIANADAAHPTETILFQNVFPAEFPDPGPFEPRQSAWLLDAAGNGYFLPDEPALQVLRQRQRSMRNTGRQQTEGEAIVAWIDHGRAPADAGYVYAVRPGSTGAAMQAYAARPDFEVVRRDEASHIVRFPAAGIDTYAFFGAPSAESHGPFRDADRPCLVMTRAEGRYLRVAVADPDLRLPAREPGLRTEGAPGAAAVLRLTLQPGWRLASGPDAVRAASPGRLELTCRDGATLEMVLEPQE